jgi:hypothetical protein
MRNNTAHHYRPGTQARAFAEGHDKVANANEAMLGLLYGPNPITDDELRALIAKSCGSRWAHTMERENDVDNRTTRRASSIQSA